MRSFSFAALCAALLLSACGPQPPKETYLIPAGFSGGFRVVYGAGGTVPPVENGRNIMRVPASRVLLVPGKAMYGTADNEYYEVDAQGNRTPLPEIHSNEMKTAQPPGILFHSTGGYGSTVSLPNQPPVKQPHTEDMGVANFIVFRVAPLSRPELEVFRENRYIDSLTDARVETYLQQTYR